MYQDYSGDAGSGIDEKLFVSVDKASHEARDSADECVTELNECGDDEYGPYKVKSKKWEITYLHSKLSTSRACQ
jgi:hypothetical protein